MDDEFGCDGIDLAGALKLMALVASPTGSGRVLLKTVSDGLLVRVAYEGGSSAQVRVRGFARGQMLADESGLRQVVAALLLEEAEPEDGAPARTRPLTLKRVGGRIEVAAGEDRMASVRSLDVALAPRAEANARIVAKTPRKALAQAVAPAVAASEWCGDGSAIPDALVRLEVDEERVWVIGGDAQRRTIAVPRARTSGQPAEAAVLPASLLRELLSCFKGKDVEIGWLEEAGRPPRLSLECGDARVVLRTGRGNELAAASMPRAGGAGRLDVAREPLSLEVRRATMLAAASGEARPLVELRPDKGGVWVVPLVREGGGRASSGWVPGAAAEGAAGGVYDGRALTGLLEGALGDRLVFDVGRPGGATAVVDAKGGWHRSFGLRQLIRCSAVRAGG